MKHYTLFWMILKSKNFVHLSVGIMSLPIAYTPLTKLTAPWDGKQGSVCGDFEMDFIRCATRVGSVRAPYDCRKELTDFSECMWKSKQVITSKFS